MAIESVGNRIGNSFYGQRPALDQTRLTPGTAAVRPEISEAMRVELSAEARRRVLLDSVTQANADAASSAGVFASDEGVALLSQFAPRPLRMR